MPIPTPGNGEVLIRAHAAGINAIDWKTRAGNGVSVPRFPAVLGWDVCGTVAAAGPGTVSFQEGDRVFGMPHFPDLARCYAEYVTAPETALARAPKTIDDASTAAAPMVVLTAWQALFEQARLVSGQLVLIHGAAGGVGHVAVQMASWAKAEVIGTASPHNHDFVAGLGARQIIDYTRERVEDAAREVDVVLDTRGDEDFDRLLHVLRPAASSSRSWAAPRNASAPQDREACASPSPMSLPTAEPLPPLRS